MLLAGTLSKLEDYSFSIFPWLWAEFQNALRKTRRVVISGYGFKDAGLNARLKSWLLHFPTARILVIHHNPSALVEDTRQEKVDAVCNFFRGVTPMELNEQNLQTTGRITFRRLRFEEASTPKWCGSISEFLDEDRP